MYILNGFVFILIGLQLPGILKQLTGYKLSARELLLKLHKEGRFSDAAIRKVERDMDINELKLNQLLPKKDE